MSLLSLARLVPMAGFLGYGFDTPGGLAHAFLTKNGHRVMINGNPGDFGWMFAIVSGTVWMMLGVIVLGGAAAKYRPVKADAATKPAVPKPTPPPATGVQGQATPAAKPTTGDVAGTPGKTDSTPSANPNVGG